MKIDTHQHFWKYNSRDYRWMNADMQKLQVDRLPMDLASLLSRAGISGTVAVQARQSLLETQWLLQLADENPFIVGVVGWIDLRGADVEEQLERFAGHPIFCGVRHVVQDEPDDRFVLQDEFQRGISRLAPLGLAYDLLVYPRQLPASAELAANFPEQVFVLDHMAKPPIRDAELEPWRTGIDKLAAFDNVYCKVSGLVTEADWAGWTPEDLVPYLNVVLDAFGTSRLMIGSDWPVCTLAAGYEQAMHIGERFVSRLSASEQQAVWFDNAVRAYHLDACKANSRH